LGVFSLQHSCNLLCFSPDAGERGLDLGFETGDEFAVGVNQRLLGFCLPAAAFY